MSSPTLPSVWTVGTEVHRHVDYYFDNSTRSSPHQLFVVQQTMDGTGFLVYQDRSQLVPAGHAMIFAHHEASAYGYPPEAQDPYRLRFISLLPGSLQPLLVDVRTEFGSVIRMSPGGEAASLMENVITLSQQSRFRDRLHVAELLFRLALAIYREQLDARQIEDPIAMGHHLLCSELGGRIGLKEIVRRIGISREHFGREYARRYGLTPGKQLRTLRLEHAHALLLSTALGLEDIAAACGFGNADSFRQAFRKRFGENPSQTRASCLRITPAGPARAFHSPGAKFP